MTATTTAQWNNLSLKDRSRIIPCIVIAMEYMSAGTHPADEIFREITSIFPEDINTHFALDLVALAVAGHDFSES